MKAYEVMAHTLVTCAPEASVAHAASLMRDGDIGDVLVVDEGKLCGIVTDRDLALLALTGQDDPQQTPVKKYMNTKVVTGESGWSLEQVAKKMARHQIRRLPIVQDGELVGIVSLGDVVQHGGRKGTVTKSLRAILEPRDVSSVGQGASRGALIGLALAALGTAMVAWFTWTLAHQPKPKSDLMNMYSEGI